MDSNSLVDERKLRLQTNQGDELLLSGQDLEGIELGSYLLWACETEFRYYKTRHTGVEAEARLLIELSDKGASDNSACQRLNDLQGVQLPAVYSSPALHLSETHFVTANVQLRSFIEQLRDDYSLRELFVGLELSMVISPEEQSEEATASEPHTSTLWPEGFDQNLYEQLCKNCDGTEHQVITGLADDGIAFLNSRFRRAQGTKDLTRFIGYWDQNSSPAENGLAAAATPTGYGQLFSEHCINQMLSDGRSAAQHYRREGLYRLAAGNSHGTAVLDVAAGADADKGSLPLIAVQLLLPRSGDDNSGGWLDAALLDGLRYMLDQVDAWWLAQKRPELALPQLVVNVSYSSQRGPHDGTTPVTRAIDELIAKRFVDGRHTLAVVYSAGNELLSKIHVASPALAPGEAMILHWQLPPDDDTPSFVELWARGTEPRFATSLYTPGGALKKQYCAHINGPSRQSHAVDAEGYVYASAIGDCHNASKQKTHCSTLLALAPTNRVEFGAAKAPIGSWAIRISNISEHPIEVQGWIQSDKSRLGESTRGRQSTFVDPLYRTHVHTAGIGTPPGSLETADQPGAVIRRSNTINALATGRHCLSAGGYQADSGRLADYSANGQRGWNSAPSVAAVSQNSAMRGVSCCGTLSGSHTQLNGTSAAAPALTKRLSQHLKDNPDSSLVNALQTMIEDDAREVFGLYGELDIDSPRKLQRLLTKKPEPA